MRKSEESFQSSQKCSQPFHPSLSMRSDNSNGSVSMKLTYTRLSNPSDQNIETNEFLSMYSPDIFSQPLSNSRTNTVKVKRSINEMLSLFTCDIEDDDSSMFSTNVSSNMKDSSTTINPVILTSNYNYAQCGSTDIEQNSCSNQETITTNSFLEMFSQRKHVTDRCRQTCDDISVHSVVNFVNTDEDTGMIDEFADDFLSADDTDIDIDIDGSHSSHGRGKYIS